VSSAPVRPLLTAPDPRAGGIPGTKARCIPGTGGGGIPGTMGVR
jgi:hypothetical protein